MPDKGEQGLHQGAHIRTCPAWTTLARSRPLPATVLSADTVLLLFFFLTRVSGLPQSIEIDQGPDKLFGRGFIWAPAAAVGRSLLLAHCPRETERAGFLYGVRGGVSPRVGLQSVVGGLPAPLLVLSAGGMRSILLLLPALQKWFFGLCASCCPEFAPTVHAHSFF